MGSHLFYGALSDRIARGQVFLISELFTVAFGIPMFMLINTSAVILVIVTIALSLLFSHDPIFAAETSWFSEQFPPHLCSTGTSLDYNTASVGAGPLPFISTGAFSMVGRTGPAVIFSLLSILSGCYVLKRQKPHRLNVINISICRRKSLVLLMIINLLCFENKCNGKQYNQEKIV